MSSPMKTNREGEAERLRFSTSLIGTNDMIEYKTKTIRGEDKNRQNTHTLKIKTAFRWKTADRNSNVHNAY
jgi:hypothetical protein